MKHVLLAVLLTVVGCASADLEPVAEQEQAVCGSTCTVTALNQTVTAPTLPQASTHLCTLSYVTCAGGHSSSPLLNWGIPMNGAHVGGSNEAVFAWPNYPPGGGNGTCRADVQCDQWSNFHGTPGTTSVSPTFSVGPWAHPSGPNPVYASGTSTVPWGWDLPCFLTQTWGLYLGEKAEVATDASGWNWALNASGYRGLGASMRCAWLGRPVNYWQLITATPNNPGVSGMTPSNGKCFIVDIEGNLDDGGVKLVGNPIQLEAWGGVTLAKAQCTWK
jgi:hypothetical protein